MQWFLDSLQLPERARIDKRIPKSMFAKYIEGTKADQRRLQDEVESLTWLYTLNPDNTGIPDHTDDFMTYHEIAVVGMTLAKGEAALRLSTLVHRSISHPVLLVCTYQEQLLCSVAQKRESLADQNKITLEQEYSTPWFLEGNYDTIASKFVARLQFSKQNSLHLKGFYLSWIEAFLAMEIAQHTNVFRVSENGHDAQVRRKTLEAYTQKNREVSLLKSQLNQESAFSEKVQLNMRIKDAERELLTLKTLL